MTKIEILNQYKKQKRNTYRECDVINAMEKYLESYKQDQALQLQQAGVSGSFTVEDMIGFADWCRNGLTNVEYSIGKIHEHLEYWIENYR